MAGQESTPPTESTSQPRFNRLFPSSFSRRDLLKVAAVGVSAVALDALGITETFKIPDAAKRAAKLASIGRDLTPSLTSGDPNKIQEAEQLLYLWVLCNTMELGARKVGYPLAADNMHRFLYGNGQPLDMSRALSWVLANPQVEADNFFKGTGILYFVKHAALIDFAKNHSGQEVQRFSASAPAVKADDIIKLYKESAQRGQLQPIAFSSAMMSADQRRHRDWRAAVGISRYQVSFMVSDPVEQYAQTDYKTIRLTDYKLTLEDRYQWGLQHDIINELGGMLAPFLRSLGLSEQRAFAWQKALLWQRLRDIERGVFPNGAKESDIDLLVKRDYAKEFDIFASTEGHNQNLTLTTKLA